MDIDALLKARDEILAIAQCHGASNVRVLGSVARGEAGPDSDVDILVDLELGRSLLDHAQLQIDLGPPHRRCSRFPGRYDASSSRSTCRMASNEERW